MSLASRVSDLAARMAVEVKAAKTRLATLEADTGWVDITINPGFAASSSGERPRVRRINGIVYTKGIFAATGIGTSGSHTVGQVPLGFISDITIPTRAGTSNGASAASVLFLTSGAISLRTNATISGYYAIGGFTWPIT